MMYLDFYIAKFVLSSSGQMIFISNYLSTMIYWPINNHKSCSFKDNMATNIAWTINTTLQSPPNSPHHCLSRFTF